MTVRDPLQDSAIITVWCGDTELFFTCTCGGKKKCFSWGYRLGYLHLIMLWLDFSFSQAVHVSTLHMNMN